MVWLIAILLAAILFGWGYLRGFIQMGISTVGFLLWLLVLVPGIKSDVSSSDPVEHVLGTELALPILALAALAINGLLFMILGIVVSVIYHRRLKYRSDEATFSLFKRLNRRTGAVLGANVSIIVMLIIGVNQYAPGYLFYQMSFLDRAGMGDVRKFSVSMQNSGLARMAATLDSRPERFYEYADLAGLIAANPLLVNRIINYPPFLKWVKWDSNDMEVLVEKAFRNLFGKLFKQVGFGEGFVEDAEFTVEGSLSDITDSSEFEYFFNTLLLMVADVRLIDYIAKDLDIEDFTTYLNTGHSPRFDEVILGRWEFRVNPSINKLRREKAGLDLEVYGSLMQSETINMGSKEFLEIKQIASSTIGLIQLTFYTDNTWEMSVPVVETVEQVPQQETESEYGDLFAEMDDRYGGLGFGPGGGQFGQVGADTVPSEPLLEVDEPFTLSIELEESGGQWNRFAPGRYRVEEDGHVMTAVFDEQSNRLELRDFPFPYISRLSIVPIDMYLSRVY